MPESPTTRRQRAAQTALLKIATSDDPPDVIRAELARVRAYLDRLWFEMVEPPP